MISIGQVSVDVLSEKYKVVLSPMFEEGRICEWNFYLFTTKNPNTDLDFAHRYETELDEGNPWIRPVKVIHGEVLRELTGLGAPAELVIKALKVAEAIETAALAADAVSV